MCKLEIDSEKQKYLINGHPIENATEIIIRITPEGIPEVKLTIMSDLDITLEDCNLTDF